MRFLAPWWLLLLLPVAALVAAYVVQHRRRSRYAVRFATQPMLSRLIPRSPGWRRHAPASAQLLALGLLAVAAARPEMDVEVPRERATVMVVLDTSLSMNATDVQPTRIDAAAKAAASFVEGLPEQYDVGVVGFARTAVVMAPLSTDREQAAGALSATSLGAGTAIGEGVFVSLRHIESFVERTGSEAPARIVLLSDGQNTTGRSPEEAAEAARDAGVPVSTIAYGSPDGGIDAGGMRILTPVDDTALDEIAETTRGSSYSAEDGDELEQVYDEIQSTIGWRTEQRDVTAYAVALGVLAALVAAALSLRWFSRLP